MRFVSFCRLSSSFSFTLVAALCSVGPASAQAGGGPEGGAPDAASPPQEAGRSDAQAPDGGRTCSTSASCAPPAPYCHATRGVCVECIGDLNCAFTTGLCDIGRGLCADACQRDSQCSGTTPYCDPAKRECVECLTGANCGVPGISCIDGSCGSCGDGLCAPREALSGSNIIFLPEPGAGDEVGSSRILCPEDCASSCPGRDLGSAVGLGVATGSGAGLPDRLATNDCGGMFVNDVSFLWRAPATGRYFFDTLRGSEYNIVYVPDGGCTSATARLCGYQRLVLDAEAGEELIIVVDQIEPEGRYVLDIHDGTTSFDAGASGCNPFDCPEPKSGKPPCCTFQSTCGEQAEGECQSEVIAPPGGGDGGVDPQVRDRCLSNAIQGNSPLCAEAAECVCAICPQPIEDCRVIPRCGELLECLVGKPCSGVGCDTAGLCGTLIASTGGLAGAAFRAASAIESCGSSASCSLTCVEDGGVSDAGDTVCTPSSEGPCRCEADGGSDGVHVCKDDGSGYGRCVCLEPKETAPARAAGGCGCITVRSSSTESGSRLALLSAALGLVLVGRRRPRALI